MSNILLRSARFEFFETNSADEIEAAVAASISAEPDRQIVVIWQAPETAEVAQSTWLRSSHLRVVVLCASPARRRGSFRKTACLAQQLAALASGARILMVAGVGDVAGFLARTIKPGDLALTFGDWDLIDSVAGFTVKIRQQSQGNRP